MWNNAHLCFVRGDFCKASTLLGEVLVINPQHRKACMLKNELNDRYFKAQQIYNEISNEPESDLAESILMVKEAIEVYPDHPSGRIIQTKLAIASEKFSEAMENGFKAFQKDQWKVSLEWFRLASQLHRAKPNLVTLIQELSQIVDAQDRIDLALQQQDFDTAQYLARWVDLQVEEMKQQIGIFSDM
jgi:tetratricopeptide (TPR) repeat protein